MGMRFWRAGGLCSGRSLWVVADEVFRRFALRQWSAHGQRHAELGALAHDALHINAALVLLHDTVRQVQPQARAFANRLGGEEGFEDALERVWRDARAAVGHLHPHLLCLDLDAGTDGDTSEL